MIEEKKMNNDFQTRYDLYEFINNELRSLRDLVLFSKLH